MSQEIPGSARMDSARSGSSARSTHLIHSMAAVPPFLQTQPKPLAAISGYCGYVPGKLDIFGATAAKVNNLASCYVDNARKTQSYDGPGGQTYHSLNPHMPGYTGYKVGQMSENIFGYTHASAISAAKVLQKNRIKQRAAMKWKAPHVPRVPGSSGLAPAYPTAPA